MDIPLNFTLIIIKPTNPAKITHAINYIQSTIPDNLSFSNPFRWCTFYSNMSSGHDKPLSKRTERIHWTFAEAQVILSISKYGLRKLMKNGLISHRIGKKVVFLKEDVEKWRKSH